MIYFRRAINAEEKGVGLVIALDCFRKFRWIRAVSHNVARDFADQDDNAFTSYIIPASHTWLMKLQWEGAKVELKH